MSLSFKVPEEQRRIYQAEEVTTDEKWEKYHSSLKRENVCWNSCYFNLVGVSVSLWYLAIWAYKPKILFESLWKMHRVLILSEIDGITDTFMRHGLI